MTKKTKNKHGFTMVELLATIAIIAILATLAIVGVSRVRKSLEKSYYNRAEKLVVAAGMEYFNDHKSERPFKVGQSTKVALKDLENQNYIEEVKGYTKESCYENESYVLITKKSEKKYQYDTYLTCPAHTDTRPSEGSTTPDVGPGGTDCAGMLSTNASGSGWSNTSVNITATKPSNIASYEIQKQSGNGWITIGSTYNTSKTITISENGIGVYHVVGRGSDGSYCTSDTVQVKIDKDKPTCGTITGESTTWTNSARTITVGCTDGENESGCVEPSYEKSFSNAKVGTITIADNAGNTNSCSVNAYADTTAPTCGTATGVSTSWTKSSRTVTQPCTDNLSGCASVSKTYSSTTKTASVSVTDGAGNSTACSAYNVYVDTTAPTCGTASGGGTSSAHKFGNVTVTQPCSDSHSGCASASYSKTFSPTTTTSTISIADKAGNSKSCTVNVYAYPCTAPSISGSVSTTKACPCKSSETLTNNKRANFTLSGCLTSLSGKVCYYNTSSTTSSGWSSNQKRHDKIVELGCKTAKCTYSSGWHGSCSGSNHGCFTSSTKWYLNRSTECSYIYAKSSGGAKEMTCKMSNGTCKSTVATMISNC